MIKRCHIAILALSFWMLLPGVGYATGIELEDDLGVEVTLVGPAQRIVSLAPSNTEMLFAIGLGERLVGVTEFCNYPEAAREVERVAGFNSMSVEKIVAARPDLVVASRGNEPEGLESLRQLGIPVFGLAIQTVDQMLVALERLGELGGVEPQAAAARGALQRRVDAVKAMVDSLEEQPRVMWGYWGEPVYTAGAGTMIDDIFTQAGGINVGRAAPGTWPQVGLETVMVWAPEVIITTYHPQSADPETLQRDVEKLRQTDGWKEVPAIKVGRIHYVEGDVLNRPGPRMVEAMEQVARLLHPELAEEQ